MNTLTRHIAAAISLSLLCAFALMHFAAGAEKNPSPKIIEAVFGIVEQRFVNKDRFDFQKMLKKGLDNLEVNIDEVLVDWNEDGKVFEIVAGEEKKSFRYEEPETWKDLERISSEVFSFVQENAREEEKKDRKIEYTMVNGMLSSVDRHSYIIPPQDYEEFIVETEGSFEGLGIVITTRKGWITVVSPIEDTPAYRAGMKSGDKIVQIENESTVNMSIVEAVHKLRGPKGTPVNIRILRDSMDKPKPLTIVRDTIKIESVETHLFDDGILYIKIKNFQRNTTDSVLEALRKRKGKQKSAGLILDLRDNPGGLLEQASSISDLFLKYGTVFGIESGGGHNIKSYSASGRSRFEIRDKTVVLINSGSASASEIVTGALKENDRALTMGTTSFGKGSIQDIFELGDGSALKLTVGKYLIPGKISIHKVGITPDIFIEEVDFSKDRAIYKTPEFSFKLEKYREENEEETREPSPPSYAFKILNESLIEEDDKKEEDREEIPKTLSESEKREKKAKDPLVAAARRIIADSQGVDRSDMLKTSSKVLSEIAKEENRHIRKKLAGLNVDWSGGTESGKSGAGAALEVEITPENGVFKAGEEAEIKVRVSNRGDSPVYGLTAVADSENRLVDGKEFIFGKIAPGKKADWKAGLKIPDNAKTRNDECVLRFFDSTGKEILSKTFTVSTKRKNRPAISYNYELVDDGRFGSKGNGDGRIGKSETIALLFRIKNTGEGGTEDMGVYLKKEPGQKLFLEKAIEEAGVMAPGEERDIAMRFRMEEKEKREEGKDKKAEFELVSNDFQIGFASRFRIDIPEHSPEKFTEKSGVVRVTERAPIFGGSFNGAQTISFAEPGSSYRVSGSTGERSKIALGKDRSGWIKTALTVPSEGKARPDFTYAFASSPVIKVNPHAIVTDREEIEISGFVRDMESVVNISFFNNDDKFHVINSEGKKQEFSVRLPLEDGMNKLQITARDSSDLRSLRTFYIRKKS